MLKRNDYKKIKAYISKLREKQIRIDKVLLFGSFYRGNAHKDSDIDLAIVSRSFGRNPLKENKFLFLLTIGIDTRIEPRAISLHDFKYENESPIIYEIKNNSIQIKV